MSLRVVRVDVNGDQATIVVESTHPKANLAIEELQTAEARRVACTEAVKQGISNPAINGLLMHPYPVTTNGQLLTDPLTQKAAAYRLDVPVRAGLR